MVTIEQKVKMFSKLIYQEVESELEDRKSESQENQAQKLEKITSQAQEKAQEILRTNDYKIRQKGIELLGKAKIENKRQILKAKEACVTKMLQRLEGKIQEFMRTPDYEKYIKNCIQRSTTLMEIGTPLRAVVNPEDSTRFKGMLERYKFSIETTQPPIIGGIIIIDPKNNTKVDFSIDTTLEEMLAAITNEIMTELEEVGDSVE